MFSTVCSWRGSTSCAWHILLMTNNRLFYGFKHFLGCFQDGRADLQGSSLLLWEPEVKSGDTSFPGFPEACSAWEVPTMHHCILWCHCYSCSFPCSCSVVPWHNQTRGCNQSRSAWKTEIVGGCSTGNKNVLVIELLLVITALSCFLCLCCETRKKTGAGGSMRRTVIKLKLCVCWGVTSLFPPYLPLKNPMCLATCIPEAKSSA